jgi:hypothetical protein
MADLSCFIFVVSLPSLTPSTPSQTRQLRASQGRVLLLSVWETLSSATGMCKISTVTAPYPTLTYPTLPYPTLLYPTLLYFTLTYPTLPYPTLPFSSLLHLLEINIPSDLTHIYSGGWTLLHLTSFSCITSTFLFDKLTNKFLFLLDR